MRMSVIGAGYLGATHAACMAELGHDVVCLDVDAEKILALQEGNPPFFEPRLAELISRNVAQGRLVFSTDPRAVVEATVHFLCVGTPQHSDTQKADLRQIYAALDALIPTLHGEHLVVGKSTVPVGTAQELQHYIAEIAPSDAQITLAWNPEFLREGHAIENTLRPERIVLGTQENTPHVAEIIRRIYAPILDTGVPLIQTDFATAELVKVSANAFLAMKISFINAVSEVCDVAGADVNQLALALGLDSRIGSQFLRAGLGYGGGCLPKDLHAFIARAQELNSAGIVQLLSSVAQINDGQRERVVTLALRACGGSLTSKSVTILGCAFKPNSDDIRESPALDVAQQCASQGARITMYDPKAMAHAQAKFPDFSYAATPYEALSGADVVILATEWEEFLALDPRTAITYVRTPQLIDARNALPAQRWREAGWHYRGVGANRYD